METFLQTIGWVAALCLGIAFMTVFFMLMHSLGRYMRGERLETVRGFLRTGHLVRVHLTTGKTLDSMRFQGFTPSGDGKNLPHELGKMLVLEDAAGGRVLIRSNIVRMIEESAAPEERVRPDCGDAS